MAFGNANSPTGERNSINSIYVNGKKIDAVNKNVNITVPTKVSQLENDKNYSLTDTTYSLGKEGNDIVLTGSDGKKTKVSDRNDNTTYTLKKEKGKIKLVGSDNKSSEVDDDNTTYEEATETKEGLMSPDMVKKLKSIEENASPLKVNSGQTTIEVKYVSGSESGDVPVSKEVVLGFRPKIIVFDDTSNLFRGDELYKDSMSFPFIKDGVFNVTCKAGSSQIFVTEVKFTDNGFLLTVTDAGFISEPCEHDYRYFALG